MGKVSVPITNDFCPQTLFLYGTYGEDKSPDFGLFCWFSYYWDEELCVMMCIGDKKLTKDRILKNKVFSANLVTEKMLPLADYLGNKDGYDKSKMDFPLQVEKGSVLDVPILSSSPVVYELEVDRSIPMGDGEVFLCKIRNVLMDESLTDGVKGAGDRISTDGEQNSDKKSIEERIQAIAPVHTTCGTYFSWSGASMGEWGAVKESFDPAKCSL